MTETTRRRFVAGALTTGAVAALPGAAEAKKKKHKAKPKRHRTRTADVCVVGAGFAGLTAARDLVNAGKSVVVLEARGIVGGRVQSHELGGGQVSERGGTFVGPTQDHVLDLAKELGVEKFDTYDTGDNVYMADGQRSTYSDTGPTGTAPLDPVILPELALAVQQLDSMASTVPVDAPWTAPKAAEWDGQTLETWIRDNSKSDKFRRLIPLATRPIFGAEPRELSLLFVLFYIAASGNETNPGTFERNFDTRDGGQMWRLVGGTQQIALRIAAQLGPRVVLRSPVRKIVQKGGRATVTSDRYTVKCKKVIVAIPPTLAGRIDYHPILPPERDQLTQRYGQGTLTKVAAVYDKPFWRDKGLTGQAVSIDGLVSATFDDSPQSGAPGVIFAFVGGDSARKYQRMSPQEGRDAVLGEFASFFGEEARTPKDYFDMRWTTEQWTRGCPVGIAGPGTLLAYGDQLRAPIGAIHWAGTETSTYWNGYMDGAVRSGQRAAREVLDEL
jgi:monoamine oxidase